VDDGHVASKSNKKSSCGDTSSVQTCSELNVEANLIGGHDTISIKVVTMNSLASLTIEQKQCFVRRGFIRESSRERSVLI